MIYPRLFHRLYAAFAGYFWIPCPLCGNHFGGHEKSGCLWLETGIGKSVCEHCERKASDINRAKGLPKWRNAQMNFPEASIRP